MSWTYHIKTGELLDPNGKFAGTGYSGEAGQWRNNPALVRDQGLGPIPPGHYNIGPAYDAPQSTGPCSMHLDPQPGTQVYGRSLFRIHGDNLRHDASHGCVILGPAIRHEIAASHDRVLEVLP